MSLGGCGLHIHTHTTHTHTHKHTHIHTHTHTHKHTYTHTHTYIHKHTYTHTTYTHTDIHNTTYMHNGEYKFQYRIYQHRFRPSLFNLCCNYCTYVAIWCLLTCTPTGSCRHTREGMTTHVMYHFHTSHQRDA